jgi:hypoxanthine phosphoribosyltransferase
MLIFKYASINLIYDDNSAGKRPMKKHYIKAQQLLDDSFKLAWQVYESGYRPNYIVGVWRGGAPIGIAVQEFLDVLGVESDHIAIRTSSYTGIGQRSKKVKVHGLSYIIRQLESEDSLLIVDDVHDTGLSIEQAIEDLTKACKKNTPEIRVATPYFKPKNNKTNGVPDYFIHETNDWLVFPHELHGLSADEIRQHKPELADLIEKMAPIIENK